ncbi:MAG: hypothetical protein GY878_25640 [Fuerstiella sp.]|nr:hypothetical protein [Fuerstiella sp.]
MPHTAADQRSQSAATDNNYVDVLSPNDAPFSAPRVLGLIVISLLPFWAVPIAHVASNPETATGFFHYELPYYVANGRAAFERGNGIFYPNPYDPALESPAIYAHWLPWMLGLATAGCGFNPGNVILSLTFFASLAFAWATWSLVQHRTCSETRFAAEPPNRGDVRGSPRHGNLAFLLAMWGGGILCFAGTVTSGLQSTPWLESVLQFDPGRGMWFLNWGRNALFPTEAVYHTLVACCWLAEIKAKQRVANACLLLLATTHPWSGLELLLTINLWRGIQFFNCRTRTARNQLSISASLLLTFLLYYKVWLPTFPQHAELQQVWELDWSLSWKSAILAYVPVFIPCVVLVFRKLATSSHIHVAASSPAADVQESEQKLAACTAGAFSRTEQLLLCALIVATGLAFHDRIINPVQPLHFTRGYVWMPMFLIGLPVITKWWNRARHGSPKYAIMLLVVAVVADNFFFSVIHSKRQFYQVDGFHLDIEERTLLSDLHGKRGAVLLESLELNYLLPSYADARPWLGHHFNTPGFPTRKAAFDRCFQADGLHPEDIPDDVRVLVLRRSPDVVELFESRVWQQTTRNTGWSVWERRVSESLPGVSAKQQVNKLKVEHAQVEPR